MTTSLANTEPVIDPSIIESVLLTGDLRKLTPPQKLSYYKSVCDSLGLNPLTQPFAYIILNNKEVLYAKREATEQLRNIRQISIDIKTREVIEGCYIVTATATMPTGRRDESTGSVAIDGVKGEARANALMKAETKAKRRVTLSICGLGLLDESEIESIASARLSPVSTETVVIERPPVKLPESTVSTASSNVIIAKTVAAGATTAFDYEPEKSMIPLAFAGVDPTKYGKHETEATVRPEVVDDDPFEDPCITSEQAGKIAKRFRESLRPELQTIAEELRHNALTYLGYIDANGNPSSLIIKAKDFIDVGRKMVTYAKGL